MIPRKISILGDSITEGAGASSKDRCFASQLEKMTGSIVKNYGIGGTRIAGQILRNAYYYGEPMSIRYKEIDSDSDLVIVFGGTNDFGHGDAPIGNKGDNSIYTFIGAMNTLVNGLIERFQKERILFILPLVRYDQDSIHGEFCVAKNMGPVLSEYVDIMKEILDSNDIRYIDFFHNPPFPKPLDGSKSKYFSDGLHPNDLGHEIISKTISNYILNNY